MENRNQEVSLEKTGQDAVLEKQSQDAVSENGNQDAILEVEELRKSFGRREVLKGVDFSMRPGEVLSIIGSSGGGKTTLLRCLNFLEIPDRGRIYVIGEKIFDAAEPVRDELRIRAARLRFGLVFQQFNLFPQYTVKENIELAPKLLGKFPEEEIGKKSASLLERVGLSDHMDQYPYQLSGGQQQRVAIARALALEPDILCFDEPTSALDPELSGEVLRVIRKLAEEKTTMIIVTHEMAFARAVSDQVIFIDEGVILEQGPPAAVFDNPQNDRTRMFLRSYEEQGKA